MKFSLRIFACLFALGFSSSAFAQELISEDDLKWLKQQQLSFGRALDKSNLNAEDTQLLKRVMEIRVKQLTMADSSGNLPALRAAVVRDIDLRASENAKKVILPEVVTHCEAIIDHPLTTIESKLNAVYLAGELNESPANFSRGVQARPFPKMAPLLLKVVSDPMTKQAFKIVACKGLQRLLEDGSPNYVDRLKIAETLIDEFDKEGQDDWYLRSILDVVSRTEIQKNNSGDEFIIDRMLKTLNDPMQPWDLRAQAAACLGRTEMDASTSPDRAKKIVLDIVKFAHDASLAYSKSPNSAHWTYTFMHIYFAFKPRVQSERALLTRVNNPPLVSQRQLITDAYQELIPIVNIVITKATIPDKSIEGLDEWLNKNADAQN